MAFILAAACGNITFAADLPVPASVQQKELANKSENARLAEQRAVAIELKPGPKQTVEVNDVKPVPNLTPTPVKPPPVEPTQASPSNLGFGITIFIVITAGMVNYGLSRRTMRNQTDEATKGRQADHQNKVSEYRHAWLQELRNTASELIKVINEGQSALMRMNLSKDYREAATHRGDQESVQENHEQVRLAYTDERTAASDIHKYVAKIKLMFKKDDPQALKLFSLLDQVKEKLSDLNVRQLDHAIIEDIVGELQVILKSEWETTKARMWQESVA